MDNKFERFTFLDYIADDTKFTDHSEMLYYTGLPYYVWKTYYVRTGTKERVRHACHSMLY